MGANFKYILYMSGHLIAVWQSLNETTRLRDWKFQSGFSLVVEQSGLVPSQAVWSGRQSGQSGQAGSLASLAKWALVRQSGYKAALITRLTRLD